MKGETIPVTRTKSLPVSGTQGKRRRKIKPKVSFSSLPPSKIEFESEQDPSVTFVDKETLFNARIALFQAEKSGKRDEKDESVLIVSDEHPQSTNDLDSVNEMLLDIVEEIEAENVTIEDCLRDAISLKVLDLEDARNIIPNFETKKVMKKTLPSDLNNNKFTQIEESDSESRLTENPIEKLIDLFSTLKTEDLARCCKFTLGKLCQLTSYEDYENVQRIAASSRSTTTRNETYDNITNIEENSITSSGFSDDCSVDTSCLSSSSTDSMEFSSLESDTDFVSTFSSVKNEFVPKTRDGKDCLRDVIPSLIDEGILKPRQGWEILSSINKDEMLMRFMDEISRSCGSVSMKRYRDNIGNSSWITPFLPHTRISESSTDLGYCSAQNESHSSPVSRAKSFHVNGQPWKKLSGKFPSNKPFTISSARSKQLGLFQRTSTPHASPEGLKEYGSLHSWCLENDLPSSVIQALRSSGCDTKEDLLDLEALDIQQLSELSRGTKSRLWVAVETLRLHNHYTECKRKLDRFANAFKSIS